MAETCWDPANLFQITDSYNALEIQCVGHAKNRQNARCRLCMSGSDATAILAKLRRLAVITPIRVSQQDLETLAKLCLCRDYHFPQWYQVTQRWKPAVARAIDHHERLANGNLNANRTRLEVLLQERQRCVEILDISEDDANLPDRLAGYLRSNEDEKSRMEITVARLQGDLTAAHVTITASEERLRGVEGELQRGKQREMQLTEDCLAAVWRIEESRNGDRTRLAELLGTLETATDDRCKLESQVAVLRDEIVTTSRRLEGERSKTKRLEEAEDTLERRLADATKETFHLGQLLDGETTKIGAVEQDKRDLERRLAEAHMGYASTQSALENEKKKTKDLEERLDDSERRVAEAFALGDQLLADERLKSRKLKKANDDLEHRLHDLRVASERVLHEERTKTRTLSDIRDELKARLAEVRANSTAQAEQARLKIAALSRDREDALDSLRRAETGLERFQSVLHRVKSDRSVLEIGMQQLRADVHSLQSANQSLADDNAALKQRLTALETTRSKRWRSRLRSFVHTTLPHIHRDPSTTACPPTHQPFI